MPRRTRLTAAGLPHLIEHRGHNGSAVFNTTADRRTFLDAVVEAAFDARCAVHGYALLVDRLLLLCTPEDAAGVPRLMQDAGRRYVRYFNTAHGRSGALWDGRYRSCLLEPLGALLCSYRYVDEAPVRAGLVSRVAGYAWSSARAHLGLETDGLLADHPGFAALGEGPRERARAYRGLTEVPLNGSAITTIDAALSACLAVGSEQFKDTLEQRFGRAVRAGRPGRPRTSRAAVREPARRRGEGDPSGVVPAGPSAP